MAAKISRFHDHINHSSDWQKNVRMTFAKQTYIFRQRNGAEFSFHTCETDQKNN